MIFYMVGKLAPNPTHSTRRLVNNIPGRGYFRAISQNRKKIATSRPPPIVERLLRSGIREELELWGGLTEHSQEGPWYLAKHFSVVLTRAASGASALAWGGVLRFASLVFQAGADFGPQWIARDIHVEEIYALHELLQAFCKEFPGRLSRVQVIADVDNFTVVHNFRKGRARDATVHCLLRALFDLQRREGFG